ncbi:hypothetical protein G4B88_014967 [Cannabis sativa]|uniref:Uncharacterized protein n=1 Tax=Cannabis sativa TaxID=3483 RepID=A0A7J6F2X2_CANSA|nr:hypothetical protein G4B88_014967 [Cannabis sativa]
MGIPMKYRLKVSPFAISHKMLGLTTSLCPTIRIPIASTLRLSLSELTYRSNLDFYNKNRRRRRRKRPTTLVAFATKNDKELKKDPREREENDGADKGGISDSDGDESGKENRRSIFSGLRWGDLVLSPDPDNILAVGLTGLLTWASVQFLDTFSMGSRCECLKVRKGLSRRVVDKFLKGSLVFLVAISSNIYFVEVIIYQSTLAKRGSLHPCNNLLKRKQKFHPSKIGQKGFPSSFHIEACQLEQKKIAELNEKTSLVLDSIRKREQDIQAAPEEEKARLRADPRTRELEASLQEILLDLRRRQREIDEESERTI